MRIERKLDFSKNHIYNNCRNCFQKFHDNGITILSRDAIEYIFKTATTPIDVNNAKYSIMHLTVISIFIFMQNFCLCLQKPVRATMLFRHL